MKNSVLSVAMMLVFLVGCASAQPDYPELIDLPGGLGKGYILHSNLVQINSRGGIESSRFAWDQPTEPMTVEFWEVYWEESMDSRLGFLTMPLMATPTAGVMPTFEETPGYINVPMPSPPAEIPLATQTAGAEIYVIYPTPTFESLETPDLGSGVHASGGATAQTTVVPAVSPTVLPVGYVFPGTDLKVIGPPTPEGWYPIREHPDFPSEFDSHWYNPATNQVARAEGPTSVGVDRICRALQIIMDYEGVLGAAELGEVNGDPACITPYLGMSVELKWQTHNLSEAELLDIAFRGRDFCVELYMATGFACGDDSASPLQYLINPSAKDGLILIDVETGNFPEEYKPFDDESPAGYAAWLDRWVAEDLKEILGRDVEVPPYPYQP